MFAVTIQCLRLKVVTGHTLLFSIKPARKVINRALMLSEKSLTVNNFTGLGYGY